VTDALIIACAQKAEHVEIACYGTARTLAQQVGMQEAVGLLEQTLEEEKRADQLLTQIAESGVNQQAVSQSSQATMM
jgi:ferritin-like metal-binding protein YciE